MMTTEQNTCATRNASLAGVSLRTQGEQKKRVLSLLWLLQDAGSGDTSCSELTAEYNARLPDGARATHQGVMSRVLGDLVTSKLIERCDARVCRSGSRRTVVPVRAVRRIGDAV